jgi:predicted RND superfamily exporter protein
MADPQQIPPVVLDGAQMEKINQLINTFNQQQGVMCDIECQENRYIKELYREYVGAKNNLRDAPTAVNNAEKNYYIAERGERWYSNYKMSEAGKKSKEDITKINDNLDNIYDSIRKNIDYYGSQLIYRKRIGDLLNDYNTKLQETQEEVKNLDSKRNVSNRLSTYYENDIQWVNSAFYYIHIVYWILAVIITILVAWRIYKKIYRGIAMKIPLLSVLLLLFMPLVLTPIMRFSIRRNRTSWRKNLIL